MAKLNLTANILRESSDAYKTLYDKDGLQVYAMKKGRFQVKCGSTHTIAKNLQDLKENIDKLGLHQFPGSGESVVNAINEKLSSTFRLEVRANKDDLLIHCVEGSKDIIAKSINGTVNADVANMVPGRRYATNGSMFGGDYIILIPMSAGQMCLDDSFSPDIDQMYEKQEFAKGTLIVGQNPLDGSTLTLLIDEVYPNGAFKDSDGVVWSKEDIKVYKFEVGRPLTDEDYQEPSKQFYDETDIPTYNPVGDVEKVAPMVGDLKNYNSILSASAGILSDFMKTAKGVAYIDRSSINKIKVSGINKEGQATDGEIEWNVRISSPHYKRSSNITIPLVMKEGSIDIGKEFIVSTGLKHPLTVDGIKAHLGTLIEGFEKFNSKEAYPSTITADKDVDNLLDGIELESAKKVSHSPETLEKAFDAFAQPGDINLKEVQHGVYMPVSDEDRKKLREIGGENLTGLSDGAGDTFTMNYDKFLALAGEKGVALTVEDMDVEGSKKVADNRWFPDTTLVDVRKPTPEEEKNNHAEVVFIRKDDKGTEYIIYGGVCHESWEQWGQPQEILADNMDDIEKWRREQPEQDVEGSKKTSGDEFNEWFDKKPKTQEEKKDKTADLSPDSLAKSISRGDTFSLSQVNESNRADVILALQKMGHSPEKVDEMLAKPVEANKKTSVKGLTRPMNDALTDYYDVSNVKKTIRRFMSDFGISESEANKIVTEWANSEMSDADLERTHPTVEANKKTAADEDLISYYYGVDTDIDEQSAIEDGLDTKADNFWNEATEAANKTESNILQWLTQNVGRNTNEGHDGNGTLLGSIAVVRGSDAHKFVMSALEDDNEEPMRTSSGTLPFDPFMGVEDRFAKVIDVQLSFLRVNNQPPETTPDYSNEPEGDNSLVGKDKKGSIKTSAFKYTGDWQQDFGDDHPLLPWMVFETVVESRDVPEDKIETVIQILTDKFSQVYKANERWAQEILNGKGNKGRDTLYAFVNHWVDALVAKNFEPSKIMKVDESAVPVEGVEGSKKVAMEPVHGFQVESVPGRYFTGTEDNGTRYAVANADEIPPSSKDIQTTNANSVDEALKVRFGSKKATMDIPDQHQLKILKDTVRNPNKGLFLGGPSAEESEQILRTKFNYTDKQIEQLKTGSIDKIAGTELWATPDGKYWLLGTTMMEPVSPTFNTKEEAVDYGIKTKRFDPSIRDRVIAEEVDGTGEPNDLSSSPDITTIPMSEIERASEKDASKKIASLKQDLLGAGLDLTEADFDSHESDLYIKSSPKVLEYLKENYQHFSNIEKFVSKIDGKEWLDIPFAFMPEHYTKGNVKAELATTTKSDIDAFKENPDDFGVPAAIAQGWNDDEITVYLEEKMFANEHYPALANKVKSDKIPGKEYLPKGTKVQMVEGDNDKRIGEIISDYEEGIDEPFADSLGDYQYLLKITEPDGRSFEAMKWEPAFKVIGTKKATIKPQAKYAVMSTFTGSKDDLKASFPDINFEEEGFDTEEVNGSVQVDRLIDGSVLANYLNKIRTDKMANVLVMELSDPDGSNQTFDGWGNIDASLLN